MERVCVGALVVRDRGTLHILLGKRAADRASYPNRWDVPGGHGEPGETPEQTLVRELQEEIGITPTTWRHLSDLRDPLPGSDEPCVLHMYVVTAWTGTPHNRLADEHAEITWFSIDDACRLELAHADYPSLFRTCASVLLPEQPGTVRRPSGPWTPAVHALLRHLEAVGFAGAPRVLGVDEGGHEVLSFLPGDTAPRPLPGWATSDDAQAGVGRLVRAYHDAVADFVPPAGCVWRTWLGTPTGDDAVVCHNDLFPPNIVFREGRPVGLIDWEFAAPAPRLWDVAGAALFWVPLMAERRTAYFGWPAGHRGARLRRLCDAYGLAPGERARLLTMLDSWHRSQYESFRTWGEAGVPGFEREWRAGRGELIQADIRWLEANRPELEQSLR
jgi:mutator protein MutT